MPSKDTKILKYKILLISKINFKNLIKHNLLFIKKIDGCKNNPQNSFTAKVSKNIPSGFSMSTISSFRSVENKHDVYRAKDCMKKFCEPLREHAVKIINFKKQKRAVNMLIKLTTKEQQESYENIKICFIFTKNLKTKNI